MNEPEVASDYTPSLHTTTCQPSTMKKGRKLMSTAPTRTAIYQCNYRAQRAQYVADLEEHIRHLEAENAQLHIDLKAACAGQAAPSPTLLEMLDPLLSQ